MAKAKQTKQIQRFATVTLANGMKKRISARGKTEREAIRKLEKLKAEYEAGLRTINSKTKFEVWYEEWFKTYKSPSVTAGTLENVKIAFRKYFLPEIGHMAISEIKPIHIKAIANQFAGLSKSYAKKSMGYLREAFKAAKQNGLISANPCDDLTLPQCNNAKQRRALTEEEEDLFKFAVENHPKGLLFGISYACGLRPGEARALKWSDVDLKAGTVSVKHAVAKGTLTLKEPKTAAGIREITMPTWYADKLRKLPLPFNRDTFIFGDGDKPITEQRYSRAWSSMLRMMDIKNGAKTYRNRIVEKTIDYKITPYYLRHTYATKLAENNIPLKESQRLLGHTKPEMTLRFYQHCTKRMERTAKELLRNIV